MAERRREIGRAQPQKLLPHIEGIAVLGRKASRGGDAFDVGEQQDAGGQRKQFVGLQQTEARHSQNAGNPFGISPVTGNPSAGRPSTVADNDRQDHDRQSDRPARQPAFAEQQQQDRDKPDRQHEPVDAAELSDKLR